MTILSPSAEAGPLSVSGAPVPIAGSSKLVNKVSVKPRLGQWSKVLTGGPNMGTDESNDMAILYPVAHRGQADAFALQDDGGLNTIDLNELYVHAANPAAPPTVA